LPASEKALCYFAAFLAKEKLKHKTIKVYLSGVRFLHISEGFSDPFQQPMNQLHHVLWGTSRRREVAIRLDSLFPQVY